MMTRKRTACASLAVCTQALVLPVSLILIPAYFGSAKYSCEAWQLCQGNVRTMQDDDKRKDDDKKKDSLCKLDCLRKGLGHLCSSLRSWRLYTQREFRQ